MRRRRDTRRRARRARPPWLATCAIVLAASGVSWVASQVSEGGDETTATTTEDEDETPPRPLRPSERLRLPVPSPDELRDDLDAHADRLAEDGLLLDLEGGEVSVRAGVIHDRSSLGYPIEYLMVTERGRVHESIFAVKARPALLDSCLRAIGLESGTGMRWEYTNEDPEQLEWMTWPAHGALVDIRVAWTDDDGVPNDVSLESMLLDLTTKEPLEGEGWVYVGSRTTRIKRGRDKYEDHFMADLEGNLVAIYLDGRGTCLFERNSLGGIDTPYTINPLRAPPRDVSVVITFRPTGEVLEERDGIPGSYKRRAADADDADPDDADPDDAGTDDAGTDDAGTDDAGTRDAGTRDAGTRDAGTRDAGTRDADADDGAGDAESGPSGGGR